MSFTGNVLGVERAEADSAMLSRAFVKTSDYSALTLTRDFNFVVGRRGTGKTALCLQVAKFYADHELVFHSSTRPEEYEVLQLQNALESLGLNYRLCRAATRIAWKVLLLTQFARELACHWKVRGTSYEQELEASVPRSLTSGDGVVSACGLIFKRALAEGIKAADLPAYLAECLNLSALQGSVARTSVDHGLSLVVQFDGLDEGWEDSDIATGILGGLAIAAADLRDAQTSIQAILYLRDNIFRSLAVRDADFSRHIEGSSLRLHWTAASLLTLIAGRLRVALGLDIENNEKVWNRFAGGGLKGRSGFDGCLHYTLYRPRDILVLLNQAAVLAARGEQAGLSKKLVETAAEQVSKDRLLDLEKEYGQVFPGLSVAVEAFRGGPTFWEYRDAVDLLDEAIRESDVESAEASDFVLLGNGSAAFEALYSVGFLGLAQHEGRKLQFCHDGSAEGASGVAAASRVAVHPCYWRALSLEGEDLDPRVALDVFDDQEVAYTGAVRDVRLRRLGEITSELPSLPSGEAGAAKFEDWVLRATKGVFGGVLANIELHPNGTAVQRRDVVATNRATSVVWRRVLEDYGARQVVFEVKNYTELKQDDYRQALSYSGKQYGRLGFIVFRGENEGLAAKERKWVREYWNLHERLVVSIPASLLVRCLRKLKNPMRRDYGEAALEKRLDTYVRRYLSEESG